MSRHSSPRLRPWSKRPRLKRPGPVPGAGHGQRRGTYVGVCRSFADGQVGSSRVQRLALDRSEKDTGWRRLGGRRLRLLAELLCPPIRFAAVELLLELRDVDRQGALAALQLLRQLRSFLLARLEPLLAHLELSLELRLLQPQLLF